MLIRHSDETTGDLLYADTLSEDGQGKTFTGQWPLAGCTGGHVFHLLLPLGGPSHGVLANGKWA